MTAGVPFWVQAQARVSPSGSLLALPSRVAVAPSPTRWSVPASAVGASLAPAVTVTVTVSAAEVLPPAVTVRLKVRVASAASCAGAVKVGLAAVALLRVTAGVPFWVQAQASVSPSGSLLALPSRVAVAPSATVWSAPALAVGARLFVAVTTVTVTVSVAVIPPGSVTVRVKVSAASLDRVDGAVKVGLAATVLLSVTVGVPPVWVQEYVSVWFSGSLLALPSRVTVAPSAARWSAPASAVGAGLFSTVTVTVSAVDASPPESVTTRLKVSVVSAETDGAVKLGFGQVALARVTAGVLVCVQAYVSVWFSGSLLAPPLSVTVAPSTTVRSAPASAVGAVFACTVTVTVSAVDVLPPAVTVRLKVSVEAAAGAVKLGFAVVAPDSVTVVPPVWAQAYVSASPSGSLLLLPSSATEAPVATVRSVPASAVGPWLLVAATTVTIVVSVAVSPPGSVTVRLNVRAASLDRLDGEVKVGFAAVALLRVTVGVPAVWDQA